MNYSRRKIAALEAMENISPPLENHATEHDPVPATADDAKLLDRPEMGRKSIVGAAVDYLGNCAGSDVYRNNCAHFLSDAFIRAGYSELLTYNSCISNGGKCATAFKRPIRAREMWCWFQSMAAESRNTLPQNEGVWAVFQLDEDAYWGGHVVIIDTNTNKYYGTGNYPRWTQHAYRW
jgi:hypothetical protein